MMIRKEESNFFINLFKKKENKVEKKPKLQALTVDEVLDSMHVGDMIYCVEFSKYVSQNDIGRGRIIGSGYGLEYSDSKLPTKFITVELEYKDFFTKKNWRKDIYVTDKRKLFKTKDEAIDAYKAWIEDQRPIALQASEDKINAEFDEKLKKLEGMR